MLIENRHYVVNPNGCWDWKLFRIWSGYGQLRYKKRTWLAHRLAWTLAHGRIPKGLCVCHSCDNPGCVNPAHLWLGTRSENVRDMYRKQRRQPRTGRRLLLAKLCPTY